MLGKSLLAILWDEEARIYRLTAYGAGNHISHCLKAWSSYSKYDLKQSPVVRSAYVGSLLFLA